MSESASSSVSPFAAARSDASRTRARASSRPRRSVRRTASRSDAIRPPVRSRLARMRSASTSRPSRALASADAAPPVAASEPDSASHSACHAPPGRSCSATSAPVRTAAWARPSSAAARAHIASTGFCLWGIAEDPPPFPSDPHLGDLGLGEKLQIEADLGDDPADEREGRAELGDPRAVRVPGQDWLDEAELPRVERRDLEAVLAQGRERAGGAAQLCGEPVGANVRQPRARVEDGLEPAGGLEPERRRDRVLQHRPPGHRRVAVLAARAPRTQRRRGRGRAARAPAPRRATSMAAVSTMS